MVNAKRITVYFNCDDEHEKALYTIIREAAKFQKHSMSREFKEVANDFCIFFMQEHGIMDKDCNFIKRNTQATMFDGFEEE